MQSSRWDADAPRPELIDAIVSGGDERMALDDRGWNRYFVPARQQGVIFCRGSCTCGFLVRDAAPAADALLRRFEDGADLGTVREEHRARLRGALGLGDDVDVFFAPSGSDLCYLPGLFQRLEGLEHLAVVVTASDELGSGSRLAHEGRCFSEQNQLGERRSIGESVGTHPNVTLLPARRPGGQPLDPRPAVLEAVEGGPPPVVELVWGSKTGLRDEHALASDLHARGATVWFDLCQLRPPTGIVRELLCEGHVVMVTGSKFFQAPPFCGAVLVPGPMAARLRSAHGDVGGYRRLFTAFDPPPSWTGLVRQLPEIPNVGLTLRWEAALYEMEAFARLPATEVQTVIEGWHLAVLEGLARHPAAFTVVPGADDSIVSFRCHSGDQPLDGPALAEIYRAIVGAHRPLEGYERAFIGQPVESGGVAMLRLALGANDIRKLLDGSESLEDDGRLIDRIAAAVTEDAP